MFLDEELLSIAYTVNTLDDKSILEGIKEMIGSCWGNIRASIQFRSSDAEILANFKRVNNTWMSVYDQLNETRTPFFKRDGFQLYIESKPEFKGVFFK